MNQPYCPVIYTAASINQPFWPATYTTACINQPYWPVTYTTACINQPYWPVTYTAPCINQPYCQVTYTAACINQPYWPVTYTALQWACTDRPDWPVAYTAVSLASQIGQWHTPKWTCIDRPDRPVTYTEVSLYWPTRLASDIHRSEPVLTDQIGQWHTLHCHSHAGAVELKTQLVVCLLLSILRCFVVILMRTPSKWLRQTLLTIGCIHNYYNMFWAAHIIDAQSGWHWHIKYLEVITTFLWQCDIQVWMYTLLLKVG